MSKDSWHRSEGPCDFSRESVSRGFEELWKMREIAPIIYGPMSKDEYKMIVELERLIRLEDEDGV